MLVPAKMTGRTIGILGLGRSGIAAAASLIAAGAKVFAADDHKIPADLPQSVCIKPWTEWPWERLELMVISPGIPHQYPIPHPAAEKARELGVAVVSEIEIAMRAAPAARVVGITGTNGKSTTTALTGHSLKQARVPVAVGGNIGDAACSINDPGPEGVIVLELSSYQLETTPSLAVDAAIVLNITPDHLDRHGGMAGYIAAKAKLPEALKPGGIAVFGAGDAHVKQLQAAASSAGQTVMNASAADAPKAARFNPALAGPHNAENAAAAALVLNFLGLDADAIAAGMASFAGLAHRMQPVAKAGQVTFVNDSKATNGVAAAKALLAFKNIFWIAGGQAKEDGLGAALDAVDSVTAAYLIGACAKDFAAALADKCPTSLHPDLRAATTAAFADAWVDGDQATILLSPAAASFDQFDNFAARGDAFASIAHQLAVSVDGSRGGANA